MMLRAVLPFLTVLLELCCVDTSFAWGLKTHLWIGQQVLNDVLSDGRVSIDTTHSYEIPKHLLEALRNHPEAYLTGNLGPDVFPDFVAGQVTTHPGVEGGWQTDQWLKHLLDTAGDHQQLAFAYGYVGHAAGDIFAHTYVNNYAGDIFELVDERDVELRHVVLEKYIEAHTPPILDTQNRLITLDAAIAEPRGFLRDQLIFSNVASEQYEKVAPALHLRSMRAVREAARSAADTYQEIVSLLLDQQTESDRAKIRAAAELGKAKLALRTAESVLDRAQAIVKATAEKLEVAIQSLDKAKYFYDNYSGFTKTYDHFLGRLGTFSDLVSTAIASKVADIASRDDRLTTLRDILKDLNGKWKDKACGSLVGSAVCNSLKKDIDNAKDEIDKLMQEVAQLTDFKSKLEQLQADALKAKDDSQAVLRDLASQYQQVKKDLEGKIYEASIATLRSTLEEAEKQLNQAQQAVRQAQATHDEFVKELEKATQFYQQVRDYLSSHAPFVLLLKNWVHDIDKAGELYIKASRLAALDVLKGVSNANHHHVDWLNCYGVVFFAVPAQIPELKCEVKTRYQVIQDEFKKLADKLPEPLRSILRFRHELMQKVLDGIQPRLVEAGKQIATHITDKHTVDLIDLLAHPEKATAEYLDEVYSSPETGSPPKHLVMFQSMSTLINADLHLDQDGKLDPARFLALKHALTLAKLSLLAPSELNRLHDDYAATPHASTRYGAKLYDETASEGKNFTLLLDAVRSIDGNHQWQAYGLPYPRRDGHIDSGYPGKRHYGYDVFSDPKSGFRFWADENAREEVFLKVFAGSPAGEIAKLPELNEGLYSFPTCDKNPYPKTQNSSGGVMDKDDYCLSWWHPKKWIWWLQK